MMRTTKRAGTRTRTMAAALLSLGAGAALAGASCAGLPCGDGDCTDPKSHTCPWRCARPVWPNDDYFDEHFNARETLMTWIGDPRDAPDCTAANAYPFRDYYQDPKSLDRCPRCVAEPKRERAYVRITTAKGGHCADETNGDASNVGGFVLPAAWDGTCVSQRVILGPHAEEADIAWGGLSYAETEPNCEVSLSAEDVAASWGTLVRACWRHWELDQICGGLGTQCDPELAAGFRDCLIYYGDEAVPECPNSHPELVQAHAGVKGCTRCDVEETGSRETTETLTFYADEGCTQPIPATGIEDDVCFDLPSGAVPRSISATSRVERTATCKAVGGEQEGELAPGNVVSLCCGPVERT
ncbi:hypothetical protein [Sorangium sp. So ce233]|uniref:hypothetical protein n=1 Tax=Sorangium sp. So ce233 TaxID=3133290 RepID=UPI003F60E1B8